MSKEKHLNSSFSIFDSANFNERKQSFIACTLLIVVTAILYSGVTKNDFIIYDDSDYVTMNDHIHNGISWENIKWSFSSTDATNWHPLTWISHSLDMQIFGLNSAAHHGMNLVYHCIATLLLFGFLIRVSIKVWVSTFIAALFALHPLHVESVAWVAERKDVLCAVLWFGTMLTYVKYTRCPAIKNYLLFLLLFVLSLMAKPMAVTLPAILLLLDYWPLERFKKDHNWWNLIYEKIPLCLMSFCSAAITLIAQKPAVGNLVNYTLESRIANAIVSYWTYIQQAFLPIKLSVFYPYEYYRLLSFKVAFCAVFIFSISIVALIFHKRYRYLFVGWFWYLISLIPVIGFVQVGNQAHADRYTYIPLVGLFLIMGIFIDSVAKANKTLRKISVFTAVFILCILSIITVTQIGFWRNDILLFSHAVKVTKGNYVAYNNLGYIYETNGRVDLAAMQYEKAIQINPKYDESQFGLGNLLLQAGQVDKAIQHLQKAIENNPNRVDFLSNLAGAYFQKQQTGMAMDLMQRALIIARAQKNNNQINDCLEKINLINQAKQGSVNK
jgi:tetratricopeptide (TPR) repeat protein